jgi:hypothetical protein
MQPIRTEGRVPALSIGIFDPWPLLKRGWPLSPFWNPTKQSVFYLYSRSLGGNTMNRIKFTIVAIVAAGLFAAATGPVFAQSDKTLGINCTVAGHERCGENGRAWVGMRRGHHYRHAYRSDRHDTQRHVIRDYPQDQVRSSGAQGPATKPETQGSGGRD